MRSLPKIFLVPTVVLILIFGFIAVQIQSIKDDPEIIKTQEIIIEKQAVLSQDTLDKIKDLEEQIEILTAINEEQAEFIKTYREEMDFFQWQLTTYEDRLVEAQRRSAP